MPVLPPQEIDSLPAAPSAPSSTPTSTQGQSPSRQFKASALPALASSVLQLYQLNGNVNQIIDTYYTKDAIFEDPLVRVSGASDFKGQFRALKGVFRKSNVDVHSISASPGHVTIDTTVTFFPRLLPDFLSFSIRTVIMLELEEGGAASGGVKIRHHHDVWSIRDLVKDNIPVVSFIYDDCFRPTMGKASSIVTNVIHDLWSSSPRPRPSYAIAESPATTTAATTSSTHTTAADNNHSNKKAPIQQPSSSSISPASAAIKGVTRTEIKNKGQVIKH